MKLFSNCTPANYLPKGSDFNSSDMRVFSLFSEKFAV